MTGDDRPWVPSHSPSPREPGADPPLLVSGGAWSGPTAPDPPRWRIWLRFLFGGRLVRDLLEGLEETLEERWLNARDDVGFELRRIPRGERPARLWRFRRLFRRPTTPPAREGDITFATFIDGEDPIVGDVYHDPRRGDCTIVEAELIGPRYWRLTIRRAP